MNKKKNILETVFEVFGWIRIFISLLLLGVIAGLIVYYLNKNILGITIATLCVLSGLLFGITLATRAWKNGGTYKALSRTMTTSDFDGDKKEKK